MSPQVEASSLMRKIAEPAPAGAHIETLIRAVSRQIGVSFSRGKALWYGEARIVRAEEMDALRAAAKRKEEVGERALQNEYATLVSRIERLEKALVQRDED